MTISVRIPSALRPECKGAAVLQVQAPTVRSALEQLAGNHPSLYRSICDETGAVRRHIHLYVNAGLVRRGDDLDIALKTDDELFIMTAVSGG
jgi:molybdopterin converting factor small subunit